MRTIIFSVLLMNSVAEVWGQSETEREQAFLDLRHDGVVMNLSAHPDDEDGATLAYYRMKYGVKTYSVFFTRGEGGQNEIGPDLYAELGVIRTEETLKAAEILKTEAHFLNLTDFGFSKNAIETYRFWGGRQEVLRRLVYFIRKFKPDVVMTNHNTATGHGHHQAVAITAIVAFDAAADPEAFPEQLSVPGVELWQPKKLYARIFGMNTGTPDVSHQVADVSEIYGRSYLDIAGSALHQHRSQGMEQANLRRPAGGESRYRLVRASSTYASDSTSFFGGINLFSDPNVSSLIEVRRMLDSLNAALPAERLLVQVSAILRRMTRLEAEMDAPLGQRLIGQWRDELGAILTNVFGLDVQVAVDDPLAIPGQEVRFTTTVSSRTVDVQPIHVDLTLPSGWKFSEGNGLDRSSPGGWTTSVAVTPEVIPTLPKSRAQYNPIETEPVFRSDLLLETEGKLVEVSATARVDVGRPLEISVSPEIALINASRAGEGKEFVCRIVNHFPHKVAGVVLVEVPAGWKAERSEFVIPAEDSATTTTILVRPPPGVTSGEYQLRFVTEYGTAEAVVKVSDVKTVPNTRLGFIKSYDNATETAADDLGVPLTLLGEQDIRLGDLTQFTAIVVDIRAYGMREDLRQHNSRLLDYVRNGGHLIVMYQKAQDWKPEYAPYPFSITRSRVVDEHAPVAILNRRHPLLTFPNMITDHDWNGWVQERGVYFPSNVNDAYERLLASHDPDEPPLDTGYLVAQWGRGTYVYTSYVWYRQLKEKHEGALKCFANMISHPFAPR